MTGASKNDPEQVAAVAATEPFGFYAAKFGNYNATYGSLGAVVVLLLWLDLSAYVLLLGAELNGELEREAKTINARPTP